MANEYRVTQVAVEALGIGDANARVSQVGAELLVSRAANARLTAVSLEVLRSVAVVTGSRRMSLM